MLLLRALASLVALSTLTGVCSADTDTEQQPPRATRLDDDVPIDVQAHRGGTGIRPESTLPAFEAGLDSLATTLELDLHVTADEELVIWHDPSVTVRHCGPGETTPPPVAAALAEGSETEVQILDHPASVFASLRCDRNPDPARHPDQRAEPGELSGDFYGLITLEDLFAFVDLYAQSDAKSAEQRENAAAVRYNIETKGRGLVMEGRLEQLLVDATPDAMRGERVSVQSFDPASVEAVRTLDRALHLVFLTPEGVPGFDTLLDAGVGTWSPNHRDLTEEAISEAHAAGLLVVPWTINDPDRMAVLVAQGVDGLITDRPDLAAEVVAR